jgi:hypothetical protein
MAVLYPTNRIQISFRHTRLAAENGERQCVRKKPQMRIFLISIDWEEISYPK